MKMLVMEVEGGGMDRLLGEEGLVSLRQLATVGCFGRLQSPASNDELQEDMLCAQAAAAGLGVVRLTEADGAAEQRLRAASQALEAGGWGYMRLDMGRAVGAGADDDIAQVLDLLDDDMVLLVLLGAAPGVSDGFVLAAPGRAAPVGELRGATMPDLGRTLLVMAGYEVPDVMEGVALVSGPVQAVRGEELEEAEEALLRARLEGLGYVG